MFTCGVYAVFQDVLWLPPASWCAFLTGNDKRNLWLAVPYFSQVLWLRHGMLNVAADILRYLGEEESKDNAHILAISSPLKGWIESFQLAARQTLPQPLPADLEGAPEAELVTQLVSEVLAESQLPDAKVQLQ